MKPSNFYRFSANVIFANELYSHPIQYLLGCDTKKYLTNIYINGPHNALLVTIFNYGILFTVFYLALTNKIISRQYNDDNIPILMGILLYFLFLGAGLTGIQFIWLAFLLKNNLKFYSNNT